MLLATCAWRAHAATSLEECRQRSAERPSILTCLDGKLREAESELAAAVSVARKDMQQIGNDKARDRALISFDRAQRRFIAYRDANCRWVADRVANSASDELFRDCLVNVTRLRRDELRAIGATR